MVLSRLSYTSRANLRQQAILPRSSTAPLEQPNREMGSKQSLQYYWVHTRS